MKPAFPKPKDIGQPKPEKERRPRPTKLTKSQRIKVYQKYDGRCSYCGTGIEFNNFQVDHKLARNRFKFPEEADFFENFMPACRPCNIRKNTMSVEKFRQELARDIEQLKRDSPKFRLLLQYGKISISGNDIVFYFEKVQRRKSA